MLRWLVLMGLLSMAAPVRASCVAMGFSLLWSYPAEGERDVPTNATFWVLSSQVLRPSAAWLNDELLHLSQTQQERGLDLDNFRIQAGELRANTLYTLRVQYPGTYGNEPKSFEVHFHTGSKSAKRGTKSRVVARSAVRDTQVLPCHELIGLQGCFDVVGERPNLAQSFELAGEAPVAWLVEMDRGVGEDSLLWPAQCGDPSLVVRESRGNECFTFRRIGVGGLIAPATKHCASSQDPPTHASQRGFRDAGHALIKREPIYEEPPAVAEPPPAEPPPEAEPPPAIVEAPPKAAPSARGCTLGTPSSPAWPAVALGLLALWTRLSVAGRRPRRRLGRRVEAGGERRAGARE